MASSDASLSCPKCRKTYKAKGYAMGKTYACPACKGPLQIENLSAIAAAVDEEIRFRDESPPPPREIPVRLGKYLIDGEVARGGMGIVYKGRQEGLDRVVAIKMLLAGFMGDPELLQRFHREARAAARLRHPNIVAIHEVGDHEGRPFFTMDFIQGKGLDAVLAQGPLALETGVRILRDVARAVHYAHEQGIIHRDLKPANILIDREGKPLVTDFGLAKDLDSKSMLSVAGEVMGTPAFMSPEQAEGNVREVDRRSDVYALGAVLYRILTGKPPFEAATAAATIYKVVHDDPTDPVRLNSRLPPELSAICMKALEKSKKDRYTSASEFAEDLDRFLNGDPVSARPLSKIALLRRRLRKQRRAVVAAGTVAGLAVLVIAAVLLFVKKSDLDLIEQNLAKPEMRLNALGALLENLENFDEKKRALALAKEAVARATDEKSRELAYARPAAALVEAYVEHLPIEKPEALRVRLIDLLASLKAREAVPGMADLVEKARGPVRLAAVKFFQAVPDARGFYALGTVVSDRDCGAEARRAIQRLYLDNVLALYHPGLGSVGGTLADLGSAVENYNRKLEDLSKEGRPQGPQDAVEQAIVELRSKDRSARMKAAYELGQSGDARARDPLFKTLLDPEEGVARMAAEGLAAAGAAEYKDRLPEQLRHERAGVRRNAAFLIGRIGDKALRPSIEAAHVKESDTDAKYAMEDALIVLR